LYSRYKAPLAVTSNSVGSKVATGEIQSILGAIAIGDASVDAIAKKGGIKKISYVDIESFSVLGIYAKLTVYVYGE
jgi:hypothetical protein